jgi:hypothetical protein
MRFGVVELRKRLRGFYQHTGGTPAFFIGWGRIAALVQEF